MEPDLRDIVLRSLESLRLPYEPTAGGGVEIRLPAELKRHFRGRDRLRVVFDEAYWQHDRESELVAIGSPFLAGLEALLRERCTLTVRVGGAWFADPEWVEDFLGKVHILNGTFARSTERIEIESTISVLYEVSIPGAVERTELVPIAFGEGLGILTPSELAARTARRWYTPEEALGFGASIEHPLIEAARAACQEELFSRLSSFIAEDERARSKQLDQQAARFREEAQARRAEAVGKADRILEIDEEERERLSHTERAAKEPWRVQERAVEVWQLARAEAEARFLRPGDDREVVVPIARTRTGRVRSDLCGTCAQIAHRYFLAPGESKTALLCEDCAGLCRETGCGEIIAKRGEPACKGCLQPRFCRKHLEPCARCGEPRCGEHGTRASCCGAWLCPAHSPPLARDGQQLCDEHGAPCTVDGKWTHKSEIISCPVTGLLLFIGNAVSPPKDDRLLHPAALQPCATTGRRLASDRMGRCAIDRALHGLDVLQEIDGDLCCPAHIVEVDQPPGRRVRADRVVICSETHKRLAPTHAERCSVLGRLYDARLLVQCPVTGKRLHRSVAVTPPGDDRLLHPSAVVHCAETRTIIARDRAVRDELATIELWLSPAGVVRCELSGKQTAKSRAGRADCCGRTVARAYLGRSPVSGKLWCKEHGVLCEAHATNVLPSESVRCAITGKSLCTDHTLKATCCDRLVAREKAILLTGGGYGCVEHYVRCSSGHPLLAREALSCVICEGAVCERHAGRDPYDSTQICCARHLSPCRRCGMVAVSDPLAGMCRSCARAAPLPEGDERWELFDRLVLPKLPSPGARPTRVRVSGSKEVTIFEVGALLSTTLYRVAGEKVEIKSYSGWRAP